MIFYVLIVLNIATSVLCAAKLDTLPVKNLCKPNTTDYSNCLTKTLKESWPQLVKGIPEINFPPLDPLFIDYGNGIVKSGDIYGEISMYNITVIGFKYVRLITFKSYIHGDKYNFEGDIFMPKLILDGGCTAIGSLGGFRMGGVGNFNATAENIKTAVNIAAHAENDTLILDQIRVLPVIDKLNMHVWDYFEGIEEFNELLEAFLNEYWPALYRVFMPRAVEVGDKWLVNYFNPFLARISLAQIFP